MAAQGNSNGELSAFSQSQWKLVTEVLQNRGFSDAKVTVNVVGKAGDNNLALLKRVIAEKNGKTFNIIAKLAPKNDESRKLMNSSVLFVIEHLMYNEVLPKFTELEKAAGIQEKERFRYAACYGTIIDEYDELILLEDLKESDFTILDRFKPLADGEIKIVLKAFAQLHSLSYVLRNKEPETFASLESKILDLWNKFPVTEQMAQFFEMIEADSISVLKDKKYIDKIKGTVSKVLVLSTKHEAWDLNSRYSVIQQGDSWTNNFMFNLEDGKPVSCCVIDYQMSRINSPVADLLYCVFLCTDHETRKQCYNDWIDYYHSELAKYMFEFGLKADYVYPRDQLDADLKRHAKVAVGMSIMAAFSLSRESAEEEILKAQMKEVDENNVDEMFELRKVATMSEKSQSFFKSRIEGIIDTCLDFGLI